MVSLGHNELRGTQSSWQVTEEYKALPTPLDKFLAGIWYDNEGHLKMNYELTNNFKDISRDITQSLSLQQSLFVDLINSLFEPVTKKPSKLWIVLSIHTFKLSVDNQSQSDRIR